MSDDLVKRLRDTDANAGAEWIRDITEEAADRIEVLEAALRDISQGKAPIGGVRGLIEHARRALEGKP
jgi:hypothetical protein